jgi:hypothetical protein
MPTQNSRIEALVRKFVSDLESVFRDSALQSVRDSLQNALGVSLGGSGGGGGRASRGGNGARKAPGRPSSTAKKGNAGNRAKAKGSKGGGRRSTEEIEQTSQQILEYVRKNPGHRAEQIKGALKLDKAAWMLPITRLVEQGHVKTKGHRRATTYTAA